MEVLASMRSCIVATSVVVPQPTKATDGGAAHPHARPRGAAAAPRLVPCVPRKPRVALMLAVRT